MRRRKRSWTDEQLISAVKDSFSYRNVIILLRLIPAGGNYRQVQEAINRLNLSTEHFRGMGWNIGLKFVPNPPKPLKILLINGSNVQSNTLKKRLFREGIKKAKCEICGWAEESIDGRIPVELDHISGQNRDNRIENLRILCPNCHSLQTTHRGKNKRVQFRNLTK